MHTLLLLKLIPCARIRPIHDMFSTQGPFCSSCLGRGFAASWAMPPGRGDPIHSLTRIWIKSGSFSHELAILIWISWVVLLVLYLFVPLLETKPEEPSPRGCHHRSCHVNFPVQLTRRFFGSVYLFTTIQTFHLSIIIIIIIIIITTTNCQTVETARPYQSAWSMHRLKAEPSCNVCNGGNCTSTDERMRIDRQAGNQPQPTGLLARLVVKVHAFWENIINPVLFYKSMTEESTTALNQTKYMHRKINKHIYINVECCNTCTPTNVPWKKD